ncbi:hypothetical protein CL689_04350 [Candidatus Saccharibacteria bacterium]|nr:hypothetical protein [Candidatus Saccharibacteria bacterium]MBJ58409.1 hypothetical protein [Candidatus Saccharibacteria bacterium]MBQ69275.1 hypothetical protein [Candidatus Saccharibacteria bacterium]|tara:strand:+ start:482 stop:1216 length:735 start_codon:yes stop_codon:yes gene_type:complete
MKFTSLNLRGFEDWERRRDRIVHHLRHEDPDVVFFQEVVFLPEISPYDPVHVLNRQLEYPHSQTTISRLQVGRDYPVYREGLAVLSRYPIISSEIIVLKQEEGDEHNRILQLIDIDKNGERIKLANLHLSITDVIDYATPQLAEVLDILKARGETRILMGDFNLTHLEETSSMWSERYIASTETPYISYPKTNKRIDYALIPREYVFDTISVSDDSLSDHRAVTVTVSPSAPAISRTRLLGFHE